MTYGKLPLWFGRVLVRLTLMFIATAMLISYAQTGYAQSTDEALRSLRQCSESYTPYWTSWRPWGDDDFCHVSAFNEEGKEKLRIINVLSLAFPHVRDTSLRNILLSCIHDFRENEGDRNNDPDRDSLEEGMDHCVVAEEGQWRLYSFQSLLNRIIGSIEQDGTHNHTSQLRNQYSSSFNICDFTSGPRTGQSMWTFLLPGTICWDFFWPQSFGVVRQGN